MGAGPKDSRSDTELVAGLNAGDRTAFDALYYRHRDWVVRLALRFTRRDEDALDVLQETFSYFFRKFPGFILTAKVTTFLYPVVRNLSIAIRTKRMRERGEEAIIDTPVRPGNPPDERAELAIVLKSLPEAQREVLLMRFVDGMSLAEIAGILTIPEGTVKSRLHNALALLKSDPRVRKYFE